MLRVGLTGGLATGKSFVGRLLEEQGCRLLKADELGHAALLPGAEAYEAALQEFGKDILDASGFIDRRRLGAIVFSDPERLQALNRIVHPVVIAKEEAWFSELERREPGAIAVVESAILIETGSYKRFDKIVLTVCGEQEQRARALHRGNLTAAEIEARIARQLPLAEKRKYAHYVIDTSGSKEDTAFQVRNLYHELRSIAG